MARHMSADEVRAFLMAGTRTGKLATVAADGRAQVVPIWFLVDDDGSLLFTCGEGSAKAKAIGRDPRVTLCVDDDAPPYSFVQVQGTASVSRDPDELLAWATRIGGRYMGADRAEEFGHRNAVVDEWLVRVTPTKVIALAGVAD